tara:strand:+ start:62 stop:220 length:159 start_codon:yes stop_codon:yes gene_type:complete
MAKKEETKKLTLDEQIEQLSQQRNQLEVAFHKCTGALELLLQMREDNSNDKK